MPHEYDLPNIDTTARDENLEEIIYHRDIEPGAIETLEDLAGVVPEDMVCADCGDRATWYVSEIKHPEGFVNDKWCVDTWWCDRCIPPAFITIWKEWPWTPDDKIEHGNIES
jgi:hypothetical protein